MSTLLPERLGRVQQGTVDWTFAKTAGGSLYRLGAYSFGGGRTFRYRRSGLVVFVPEGCAAPECDPGDPYWELHRVEQ